MHSWPLSNDIKERSIVTCWALRDPDAADEVFQDFALRMVKGLFAGPILNGDGSAIT